MQQTFTKQFMIDNCGCYSLSTLMACSFMKKEGGAVELADIVKSGISLNDGYWFVCKKVASVQENQQIAINVAEIVLPIFKKRYPENKAPKEAIEAAKQYLGGHISLEQLLEKINNAFAYAAAVSFFAYAAASAAYAAAYAASAASDASAAYAASAYAASATADAVDIKQKLYDYLAKITSNK